MRAAAFRRSAGSKRDRAPPVALRRNTVTSPRKPGACRTLAAEAVLKASDGAHRCRGAHAGSPSHLTATNYDERKQPANEHLRGCGELSRTAPCRRKPVRASVRARLGSAPGVDEPLFGIEKHSRLPSRAVVVFTAGAVDQAVATLVAELHAANATDRIRAAVQTLDRACVFCEKSPRAGAALGMATPALQAAGGKRRPRCNQVWI